MKLAIIIPAYNCEATIVDTLCSLQDIESGWDSVEQVVVCDDASSDNTVPQLKSVPFDRCPLTLLRHDSNKGEAACYGTMIKVLGDSVEWFLILHSDDIALGSFLRRNLEILTQCNEHVAAVSSNYYVLGRSGEFLAHSPAEDKIIFRGDAKNDIYHTATVGCWWHISGSLINKTVWQEFGGRDPLLPQVGDWDLMLRWQVAGYRVGHSLIATTKCRVNHASSISSQSYTEFRDVRERTKVILDYPAVFSPGIKKRLAIELGLSTIRRVCRLLLNGRLEAAGRGMSTGVRCVAALLRECKVAWIDIILTSRYKAKMYYRWVSGFGLSGLHKMICCDGSRGPGYVKLTSRQFGLIMCRECQEDFAAINTVMCFGAYSIPAGDRKFGSVLDLGANVGIATRYFLAALPNVSVVALEPSADNCKVFRMNMAISEGEDRVRLWECAVGAVGGRGQLRSVEGARFDSFKIERSPSGAPSCGGQTIEVRAIADVTKTLAEPILLKMDIEGSENDVLACRHQWIGRVGYMMIEFHDRVQEKMWLSVLAAEGWKSEKHFDTWHFRK
jgi:FkbM family methyltransferase